MGENRTDPLPGMDMPRIEALTKAALELKEVRKSRMDAGKQEKEAQEKVLSIMRENKIDVYVDSDYDPPLKVEIVATEKVKVRMKDEEGEEE